MEIGKLTESQMEAILGPENKAFETLISNHIENDPEAESMFEVMKHKDPESFALKLAHYLGLDHDIDTRQACAQLLKKLLINDDVDDLCISTWRSLSVSAQSTIKCTLLDRMNPDEESRLIILELSYIVFKLAASLLPHKNWPELLPFLFQCLSTNNSNNLLKEFVLLIFSDQAKAIGETIVSPWVKPLHLLFRNTLNDDTLDIHLRIAAIFAVIRFIQHLPRPNEKEQFQDLLPGMLSTLTDALREGWKAKDVLEFFIELAKNEPRFLRMQLVEVVHTVFEIAEAESLEEEIRHLAVEFFMTLVEAKEKTPGMMKRLPFFISRCFALLLNLLLNVKDDPAWHSAENVFDTTGATNSYFLGWGCLIRFSYALGGNSVGHTAKEQLYAYLAAPEWEKHYAALIALACVYKLCLKVMIKDVDQLMEMVLNCFQDPHPRVRWAACMYIGPLLSYSPRHIQEQYYNQVFLAVAAAMDDFHPRVQVCSIAALMDLGGMDMPETLILHLDGIVNKLLVFLQNDKQMVLQQALAAMAVIARSVNEHFHIYYDTVMPRLTTVMRNAYLKSNLTLCTIAMEFISLVGVVVGKEKFREDAKQVTDVFMSLQGQEVKVDDHATSYMLRACSRVCVCIGKDFLPYMSTVMPILIQYALLEPDATVSTKSKYYKIFGLNDILIEGVNRPEVLEVKARACLCLSSYADTLKEDFQPWIRQAVSIFVPLLKFYTDNIIRRYAVEAMPILLSSSKLAVEKGIGQGESESYFKELSDYIILSLVEALHEEHVKEIRAVMLDKLNHCLQICQPLLNEDHLHRIVDEVKHVLTENSKRKIKLMERAKTEDFDAEEAQLLREEKEQEDKILVPVRIILVTLIKAFKAAFLPFFDELSAYLIPMWGKDMTPQERCTIIIIDHLIEECPEVALKYCDVFLPLLLDASNAENPEVRQNALYGLVLYAEHGGSVFKSVVREAISRINVVIMHFRSHELENERAYDNAVSALGKICEFHRETIDSCQVIPIWLNCLPIKGDLHEAKYVHHLLCSMVERLDMELMGPNHEYLPKIISVFAEVLCSEKDLATEKTKNRMINALKPLKQALLPGTLELALTYLLPRHEMELRSILSPQLKE